MFTNSVIEEYATQTVKYILISLFGYSYVFIMMYVLKGLYRVHASLAYVLVYLSVYAIDYYVTSRYLFKTKSDVNKITKYIIYLVVFFAVSNVIFNALVFFRLHYLIATFAVVVLLFPARFLTNKFIVFK